MVTNGLQLLWRADGIIQVGKRNLIESRISRASRVERVVRLAATRRLATVALEECAFALAPTLGGAILLLLLGTQILHWYWLAILGSGGVAIAILRLRQRRFSHYQTAQVLDTRLRLSDSLSTAWFLVRQK